MHLFETQALDTANWFRFSLANFVDRSCTLLGRMHVAQHQPSKTVYTGLMPLRHVRL